MRKFVLALAAVLVVLLSGTPAWAHAQLLSALPAKDATLGSAPTSVTLQFSERLRPGFATIVVSDADRRRIAATEPAVDAATGSVALSEPLGNGAYTVAYRVVSADGHTLQGSYTFTVADSTIASSSFPTSLVIGLAASATVLAGVLVLMLRWRSRRRLSGAAP